MNSAKQLLKQYKIPVTEQRLAILDSFINSNEPLNHNMLEKRTGDITSRYSVYRGLKLFLKKGLLHTLPSEDGTVWYILQTALPAETIHNHIHFLCRTCGKIYCLQDVPLPKIKVSASFKAEKTEVVVKGLCAVCNSRMKQA